MRILFRIITLTILASLMFAQDFGRITNPDEEQKQEDRPQSAEAVRAMYALEGVVDPDTYILGPGDEIGLNILTRKTLTVPLRVTPTGDLFIPSVGLYHVAGQTLSSAIIGVQNFINKKAFPQAETHMVLLNMRQFRIQISGAVVNPGFVNITPLTRLDEVIDLVEGFHQLAKEYEIEIIRADNRRETINYHEYLLEGELKSNPTFLEGDQIKVPFGEIAVNGIVVRGSITGSGYDLISPNETLGNFIRRQVVFEKNADLQNINITRLANNSAQDLVVKPNEFDQTSLKAGDIVNFMWERGITVTGFVQSPGGFSYFPGFSSSDYIALAGGNTSNGNPKAVSVRHKDGSLETGEGVSVMRGDVIHVPRTKKDIFIGDSSLLQVLTATMTIYLTFLAIN